MYKHTRLFKDKLNINSKVKYRKNKKNSKLKKIKDYLIKYKFIVYSKRVLFLHSNHILRYRLSNYY